MTDIHILLEKDIETFNLYRLGTQYPGQEISWVVANGLLIADRSLLTCISWEDLFENHLIFGQKSRLMDIHSSLGC